MLRSSNYIMEKMLVHEVHNSDLRERHRFTGQTHSYTTKKATETSPTSKLVSYKQCLDLCCILIRTETLKSKAALKHTSNSKFSKNWCLKTLFKLFESLELPTSRAINKTIVKKNFMSSKIQFGILQK